jgi:hypothetical protein
MARKNCANFSPMGRSRLYHANQIGHTNDEEVDPEIVDQHNRRRDDAARRNKNKKHQVFFSMSA